MKMRIRYGLSLAILYVCFVSLAFGQDAAAPQKVTDEEYRVYEAVILDMFVGKSVDEGRDNPRQLVILEQTVTNFPAARSPETVASLKGMLPGLSDETATDYVARLKTKGTLSSSLNLKVSYTLLPEKELDRIFSNGPAGWPKFYNKYPKSSGYVGFSRVGFSKAGDQAVVYVSHGCGGLCGSGNYVLLVKTNNAWTVKQKMMAWIS
jgi:hypothetical protein